MIRIQWCERLKEDLRRNAQSKKMKDKRICRIFRLTSSCHRTGTVSTSARRGNPEPRGGGGRWRKGERSVAEITWENWLARGT